MLSIYREHLDEAAFLGERRARCLAWLEGDHRHQAMLEARRERHLDALSALVDEAAPVLLRALDGDDLAQRATALGALLRSAQSADALGWLDAAPGAVLGDRAVYEAVAAEGRASAASVMDRWLAEGDAPRQSFALALLDRWDDPRAEAIAARALRRGVDGLLGVSVVALARRGVAVDPGALGRALGDGRGADERAGVLEALGRGHPALATEWARRLWDEGHDAGDVAGVLLGLSGDEGDLGRLREAMTDERRTKAVGLGLALAGDGDAVAAMGEGASVPRVSNALREASYALEGGDPPPVLMGPRQREDDTDRAARVAADRAMAERCAAKSGEPGRWGTDGSAEALRARYATLGGRHRRWCAIALARATGRRVEAPCAEASAEVHRGWGR